MVGILREKFARLGLTYSIGGQISFDVFPKVMASCTESLYCFPAVPASYVVVKTRAIKELVSGRSYGATSRTATCTCAAVPILT